MEILSLIFKFSHSIESSERILSCIAEARIIPGISRVISEKYRIVDFLLHHKMFSRVPVRNYTTPADLTLWAIGIARRLK